MPVPKNKVKGGPHPKPTTTLTAFTNDDVLALAETAEYLRVTENEVARLVRDQGLPGRKLGDEWQLLRIALQDWLRAPPSKKEGLLMQIGAFKDDPNLGEMLEQIHKQRGRRDAEED
ncbi:MAG TPA: helix-turn-helix domain-containing protein [Gemmataceae bacterium]|nr:helix-turn-helix domain-containing protein [Gemmataceae bacterium]